METSLFSAPLSELTTEELAELKRLKREYDIYLYSDSSTKRNGGTVYEHKSGWDRLVFLAKSATGTWLTESDNQEFHEFATLEEAVENLCDMIDDLDSGYSWNY